MAEPEGDGHTCVACALRVHCYMLASSRAAYHRPEQVGCLGFLRWTVRALAEDIGMMDAGAVAGAGAGACTVTGSFVVEEAE